MNITQCIIEKINEGRNLFITGSGGTGKSYQLNRIMEAFKGKKRIVASASTGTASVHLNGITADSFFGTMGKTKVADLVKIKKVREHWEKVINRVGYTDYLILDEVSMIRSDKLDLMDAIARTVRSQLFLHQFYSGCLGGKLTKDDQFKATQKAKEIFDSPFGGMGVIFSGDFLQIPPVVKRNDDVQINENGEEEPWAFQSVSWKSANPFIIHLTKIMRQEDEEFISALQQVRLGRVTKSVDNYFRARMNIENDCEVKLFSKNDIVNKVNEEKINRFEGREIIFNAVYSVHEHYENSDASEIKKLYMIMGKNTLMQRNLKIKNGCKIMCLINNDKQEFVNGSIGTFEKACYFIETYGENGPKKKYEDIESLLDDVGENDEENPWYEWFGSDLAIYNKKAYELMEKDFHNYTRSQGKLSKREALLVKLDNGKKVFIERDSKEYKSGDIINEEDKEIEADISMCQFPIKLAYAITMHKSQGMTLEELEIDFDDCFADGSGYVALSRCRTYEGVYLKNWNAYKIRANIDALIYYNTLEDVINAQ